MQFTLFGIDLFTPDRLFGFYFFGFNLGYNSRYLFCIYWNDGEFFCDMFWLRFHFN